MRWYMGINAATTHGDASSSERLAMPRIPTHDSFASAIYQDVPGFDQHGSIAEGMD